MLLNKKFGITSRDKQCAKTCSPQGLCVSLTPSKSIVLYYCGTCNKFKIKKLRFNKKTSRVQRTKHNCTGLL